MASEETGGIRKYGSVGWELRIVVGILAKTVLSIIHRIKQEIAKKNCRIDDWWLAWQNCEGMEVSNGNAHLHAYSDVANGRPAQQRVSRRRLATGTEPNNNVLTEKRAVSCNVCDLQDLSF